MMGIPIPSRLAVWAELGLISLLVSRSLICWSSCWDTSWASVCVWSTEENNGHTSISDSRGELAVSVQQ